MDHTRLDHVSVHHAGLDYWPDAFAHTHVDVGKQVTSVLHKLNVLTQTYAHRHACI